MKVNHEANFKFQNLDVIIHIVNKYCKSGRLLSCLAKCYYVGNLPNSTRQAGYFSIHGLLLLNLLKSCTFLLVFLFEKVSEGFCFLFGNTTLVEDIIFSISHLNKLLTYDLSHKDVHFGIICIIIIQKSLAVY